MSASPSHPKSMARPSLSPCPRASTISTPKPWRARTSAWSRTLERVDPAPWRRTTAARFVEGTYHAREPHTVGRHQLHVGEREIARLGCRADVGSGCVRGHDRRRHRHRGHGQHEQRTAGGRRSGGAAGGPRDASRHPSAKEHQPGDRARDGRRCDSAANLRFTTWGRNATPTTTAATPMAPAIRPAGRSSHLLSHASTPRWRGPRRTPAPAAPRPNRRGRRTRSLQRRRP